MVGSSIHITSYSKGRKTLGLRSFVANFSQAFMRPLVRRYPMFSMNVLCFEDWIAKPAFIAVDLYLVWS